MVKEYEGGVHLKAVHGQKISVSRVVDLAVYMACFPGNEEQWPVSKWKIQRVTVFNTDMSLLHLLISTFCLRTCSKHS